MNARSAHYTKLRKIIAILRLNTVNWNENTGDFVFSFCVLYN